MMPRTRLSASLSAYLLALHVPLFGCAALLLPARPLWFLGCEAALLASLALGWRLVRRALEPLDYTRRLRDLLQDRDYGHRLAQPGTPDEPDARDELGELVAAFNAMLDTLHRERLAQGEQRGFLERLLAATPSAVLVFDFDGALTLVNPSAVALLGFERPLGRPLAAWIDGGDFLPTLDARARERARDLARKLDALPVGTAQLLEDTDGRRWRAQRGHFFDRGFVRHFLLVDELTAELDDSERAATARLIRVLAHEVNNTLAATRSVLDSLLAYRGRLAEPDDGDFATAIVAVQRRNVGLGEFIERISAVVKMPAPAPRPVDLKALADDILWLSRDGCALLGVELGWGRRDAPAPLALDARLMEQALLNIVKNAMEAAAERERGFVRIELADEERCVRLSVVNSGDLPPDGGRRLFEPFVTTRKGGQGIGLMFVREVLARHGCAYALAPAGIGETRFDIWFDKHA